MPASETASEVSFRYELYVDRGGTFTDCVLVDHVEGRIEAMKLLSTDDAPVRAARALLRVDELPPIDLRLGTTIATNALLERRGARVGLVTTEGFGDLAAIGDQSRASLFALDVAPRAVLHEATLEVSARVAVDGLRLAPLDEGAVSVGLRAMRARGVTSLAVALVHAHAFPEDELCIAALAYDAGFASVSLSHAVVPELGLLPRLATTLVDAYVTPVLVAYVRSLEAALPGSRIRFAASSGALAAARRVRGRDAVLSGPAGGVVATSALARRLGVPFAVAFDMGGTSTDVCRVTHEPELVHEGRVAGLPVRAPSMPVHTVAAGGGSICRVAGGRLVVGPESAGSVPGPLAYGRPEAHAITLTDAALVLGRLPTEGLPIALFPERARAALAQAGRSIGFDAEALAEGFLTVAVTRMASAIREISVAQGYDPREVPLVVYGGAGGQYAGLVARELGMRRLVFSPYAGVFSAFGIGLASVGTHLDADAGRVPLDEADLGALAARFDALEVEARATLAREGATAAIVRREVDLRYVGADTSIGVPFGTPSSMREAFEREHARLFGYQKPDARVEVVTLRLSAREGAREGALAVPTRPRFAPTRTRLVSRGEAQEVPLLDVLDVHERGVVGPVVLRDPWCTIVVEAGMRAHRTDHGLEIVDEQATVPALGALDPTRIEVMNHAFMSVAEQMGAVLRRTAVSTNIRDRLDFSCAVFDRDGALIANAPHIPVHLGAMGECVRAVHEAHPSPSPGDAFLVNDPALGGSHLPDLTVVSPVHDADGTLAFWVASRGHHADVGGATPGSMPAFSRTLAEEGIVFRAMPIVRGGRFDEAAVRRALAEGPHPARRPDENVSDLVAKLAANQRGAAGLLELCAQHGTHLVHRAMEAVQHTADLAVQEALLALPQGTHAFEDALDDGTRIAVRVSVQGRSAVVDFEGTSEAVHTNSNAPRAVTRSAVLYVLRSLVGKEIPLNAGCMRSVTLRIPAGSLLDPPVGRAVVAGNVETSQRVVDVLLGALSVAAASQGTMNNIAFGNEHFGYYETLAGGTGATPRARGASATHAHMTNSRLTDVEVIESRFPVRMLRTEIRRGSGGEGAHAGGDGMVRAYRFLAPVRVSVVSERRSRPPFGLSGGAPGALGRNLLNGVPMPGRFEQDVSAGAELVVLTPGGGGFGARCAGDAG